MVTRSKKLEQLHLLLGLPIPVTRAEDRYPLFVLNALLGGTMSSRLFQSIREERGLAYTVYSGVNAFIDSTDNPGNLEKAKALRAEITAK